MSQPPEDDLSQFSMLELFRIEAESQTAALTEGLLGLEKNPQDADRLKALMRAAHSLKGAGRIINLDVAVQVAHVMEDCFVAAQEGRLVLQREQIDLLLQGVDFLTSIANLKEADLPQWTALNRGALADFVRAVADTTAAGKTSVSTPASTAPAVVVEAVPKAEPAASATAKPAAPVTTNAVTEEGDRVLRVTADNLQRLLGLAGESQVEARWVRPFAEHLQRLKRLQFEVLQSLDGLRQTLETDHLDETTSLRLQEAQDKALQCRQFLADRLADLEMFDRRSSNLSQRLYREVLDCRMRPFADGVQAFPRMIRDVARTLGKQAKLEIIGEDTQVDRDILERLEAPLTHLLRNALDHGIETPEVRTAAGKNPEGVVRLEARHSAGMLIITVTDDGRGIVLDDLKATVVRKKLSTRDVVDRMTEAELLEFLFLPGFTTKESVTEISGRGVGLDVVQEMVRQVRGTVRILREPGRGTKFQLQLPLALSVIRSLLVEVAGEPYAFPLAYIVRAVKVPKEKIETLEGRPHFQMEGQPVGLIAMSQVLGLKNASLENTDWPVVVVGEKTARFGLVLDRFLGERELVMQPLDARLGKVKDISAAALMKDGSPVLVFDVEDLLRSVEKIAGGQLTGLQGGQGAKVAARKRILVVDDSLTVRELERKLLGGRGYEVEVAVDGMDGWNAARTGHYNLIVTDVDMPRMDGIELVTMLKRDPNLKALPVMIVSYKDREEDRRRGLEAGADYYLTKGSFHDETLLNAVRDLIGEPT